MFKPKATLENFFQKHYEESVPFYRPSEQDNVTRNPGSSTTVDLWHKQINAIHGSDPQIQQHDEHVLVVELIALHIELCSLAFDHYLESGISAKNGQRVRQGLFTRDYLRQNNLPDAWDRMLFYGQAIASSAVWQQPQTVQAMMDTQRTMTATNLKRHTQDHDVIVRIANRTGTRKFWRQGTTTALIAMKFYTSMNQSSREASKDFADAIAQFIYSSYDNCMKTLQHVRTV